MIMLSFPVLKFVHFKMLPSADKNQFFIYLDLPEGTDTPQTEKVSKWINKEVLKNKNVNSIQSFVGTTAVVDFNGLFRGANLRKSPNMASLRINLVDSEDRNETSSEIVSKIRQEISQEKSKANKELLPWLRNMKTKFVEDPPGPPVNATMEIKIKGPDRNILEEITKKIEKITKKIDGVVDIDTSIEYPAQKTVIKINHRKALQAGISTQDVKETLSIILKSTIIDQYHLKNSPSIATIDFIVKAEDRNNCKI